MEDRAIVNKIIPFSNVDGPGNRLSIFFQQCNANCVYCHNRETINLCNACGICVEKCPKGALTIKDNKVFYDENLCCECDTCIKSCPNNSSPRTREYTVEELLKIINEYKSFIRGITVSGGEATLRKEFVYNLFVEVKKLGLTCFVDTNGFSKVEDLSELIKVTDKFMVDIKAIDEVEKLCKIDNINNIDNLKKLLKLNKVYEVRTVIIENYMDIENTVKTVATILKDYPEVVYKLIRVHHTGLKDEYRNIVKNNEPSQEYMDRLIEEVRKIRKQNR